MCKPDGRTLFRNPHCPRPDPAHRLGQSPVQSSASNCYLYREQRKDNDVIDDSASLAR